MSRHCWSEPAIAAGRGFRRHAARPHGVLSWNGWDYLREALIRYPQFKVLGGKGSGFDFPRVDAEPHVVVLDDMQSAPDVSVQARA